MGLFGYPVWANAAAVSLCCCAGGGGGVTARPTAAEHMYSVASKEEIRVGLVGPTASKRFAVKALLGTNRIVDGSATRKRKSKEQTLMPSHKLSLCYCQGLCKF
jgi:hypothetical protein